MTNLKTVTLNLEAVSAEIYSIVIEKQIPGIFNGKMDRVKN